MAPHALLSLNALEIVRPIAVGLIYVFLCSFLAEPHRRQLNAIMIAGAGAAYLNGGLGVWELGFTAMLTIFAYKGLNSYFFIGIGWLCHSGWDILHDLYGSPIIPFAPTSSIGCAICDPVIAAWCFAGGPSLLRWHLRRRGT